MKQTKKPKPEQKNLLLFVLHKKISAVPKVTEEANSSKINTMRQKLKKRRMLSHFLSLDQSQHQEVRQGQQALIKDSLSSDYTLTHNSKINTLVIRLQQDIPACCILAVLLL